MEAANTRSARSDEAPLRQAAVLLIVYKRGGEPWILFTKRTDRVADHKGQICFPGGSKEPPDASLRDTALRETWEEIGVAPEVVRVVGALAPVYTVATRFVIAPYLAYSPARPTIRPDAFEVAEVIDAPLSALLDPRTRRVEIWDSHGVPREVFFYDFGQHVIWGATARILKQFLDTYTEDWWRAVVRGDIAYQPGEEQPPTPV